MTGHGANPPVVVGVDGSRAALHAVRWAADEAARRRTELRIVHAAGIPRVSLLGTVPEPPGVRAGLRDRGWRLLREAAFAAQQATGEESELVLDDELPVLTLLRAADTARMVVLGPSGHGGYLPGVLLGSTAVQVSAHATSPVVVVRGTDDEPGTARGPVVVGVDGSLASGAALYHAFEEASLRKAPLLAVHAWQDLMAEGLLTDASSYLSWEPEADLEQRVLAESLAGWAERFPDVEVRRSVVREQPRRALLAASEQAQLVVVGARGRGGFRGLSLGSVSQALIHHADCPVLVVRARDSVAEAA